MSVISEKPIPGRKKTKEDLVTNEKAKSAPEWKGLLNEMKRKKKLNTADGAYDLSPEGETMPSNNKPKKVVKKKNQMW